MKRKSVPKSVETKVLTKSRRRCCLCYGLKLDDSEKAGQIAHLDGNASNNDIQNLAFLCLEHHDKYDGSTSQSKGYTIQEVKNYRRQLYDYLTNAIIGKEEIEQSLKTEAQNLSGDRYPLYVLLPLDLKIKNESIEVGMFESAACIFYWSEQEGKFIEQWIAD